MNNIASIAIKLFGGDEPCRCGGAHEICLHCEQCRVSEPDRVYDPALGIAAVIDATVLKATANSQEVIDLCQIANRYQTASVCINSHFIPLIKAALDCVKSCTVINFPLGSSSASAIASETEAVLDLGVDEVDMVQNLSALFSNDQESALASILAASRQCMKRGALLKVILETCYLSETQIITSCLLAKKAGAHFVKTSTGFGTGGATTEHIALMRKVVGPKLGVKASGGIKTRESALAMLSAGANRIGASSVTALL